MINLKFLKLETEFFQIGILNNNFEFLASFVQILDIGLKYIPDYNLDNFSFFSHLFKNFDDSFLNLIRQFFIKEVLLYRKSKKTFTEFETIVNSTVDTNVTYYENSLVSDTPEDFCNPNVPFNDPIEVFFHLNRKKEFQNNFYFKNLIFSGNCVEFYLNLFKEIENVKLKNESYLESEKIRILKKFIKEKPFKIVNLDKNKGTEIISYETLVE